jgi:hypothetical protein
MSKPTTDDLRAKANAMGSPPYPSR